MVEGKKSKWYQVGSMLACSLFGGTVQGASAQPLEKKTNFTPPEIKDSLLYDLNKNIGYYKNLDPKDMFKLNTVNSNYAKKVEIPGKVSSNSRKQKDYDFFEYPDELGKQADKYWEQGKSLEWFVTILGQGAAGINDIVEAPVNLGCGIVGGAGGVVGQILGKEGDNFEKGYKDGEKLGKDFMGGVIGGPLYNEVYGKLLSGDLKGAIELPYRVADTEFRGHVNTAIVHCSTAAAIVLPLVKHGHAKAAPSGPGPFPPSP